MPFSPSRLQAAAVLAGQFTASWDSWSWRQSAAAWLARLLPLTAAELRPALAQAAGTPGVLAQRDATRQAATAAPAAEQIRDLTPGSVTVAVTVRQVISSTSGTTQAVASFAVTLTPAAPAGPSGTSSPPAPGTARGHAMTHPGADRGSAAIALAAGAAVLLLIVILIGAAAGNTGQQAAACQAQPAASTAAASIPASYLTDYRESRRPVRHRVDGTRRDRDRRERQRPVDRAGRAFRHQPLRGGRADAVGTGGAAGNTWGGAPIHPAPERTGGFGIDGDGDGIADVYDPGDAIPSAAWFLLAHGASTGLQAALFDWNHSAAYVSDVLSWASRYAAGGAAAVSAASSPQCQLAAAGPLLAGTAGKVIAYAEAQLGKPYQWGGTGPDAFDCSGLAMMAYRAAGITIPRTSQDQWQFGSRIPPPAAEPGDLVFFAGGDGTPQAPGHVGIVIGNGKMIEAYATGYPVRVATYGQPSSPPGDQAVVGVTRP